ncbi:MAG: hypothetical protein AABW93_04135 [Nanoarchaeota archaeon]
MEKSIESNDTRRDVSPKLTDLIPGYGAINYVWRTTYEIGEKPSVGDEVKGGLLTLAQLVYNSVIGVEIWNALEGKPSFTRQLLEKLL